MSEPLRYAKHEALEQAPLVEALFEIRMLPTKQKTFSLIPGEVAERIKQVYPDIKETDAAKFIGLITLPPEVALMITHRFCSADGKQLVQIAPNGISINSLNYEDFEIFKDRTTFALSAYLDVYKPESILRIGLRYINKIPHESMLGGITAKINWPAMNNICLSGISARGVFTATDGHGQMGIVISTETSAHSLNTVLDLEFWKEPNKILTLSEIDSWTQEAHEQIYGAFKSLIEPPLYESWKKKSIENRAIVGAGT